MGLLSALFTPGNENQQSDNMILRTLVDAVKHLDAPQARDQVTQLSVMVSEDTVPPLFYTPSDGTLLSLKLLIPAGSLDLTITRGPDDTEVFDDSVSDIAGEAYELLEAPIALTAGEIFFLASVANVVTVSNLLFVFRFRPTTVPE